MFKWPGVPSPCADEHEIADFAELLCWREGTSSVNSLVHTLARLSENEYSDGVPEEECLFERVVKAYQEIELRLKDCGGGYPFCLGNRGDTLHSLPCNNSGKYAIYKYLLLATRLNMANNRSHACIDGTHLFEWLSAEACKEYFGKRADSMVFGTAAGASGFQEKVNVLCVKLGEGTGYTTHVRDQGNEKDGKLDVVAWTHFSDGLAGKLIAFGQCKTGTEFRNALTELQPDSFCRKWMRTPLALNPVRTFFIAEALPRLNWFNYVSDGGLVFDRCRIVDFSSHVSQDTSTRVEAWTHAAACATGLPYC